MKVLITAGGTTEKIDTVRAITNHSTGKLGRLIAEAFLDLQAQVDYITTTHSEKPIEQERLKIFIVEDTLSLSETLEKRLVATSYDIVIHSMAVSDFSFAQSLTQEQFLSKLNQFVERQQPVTVADLDDFLLSNQPKENKISSQTEQLYLILNKTPKVIQRIKQLQPETKLVGFKLLVDVPLDELLTVARKSLESNQADYVLANDLTSIQQGKHVGYLLNRQGKIEGSATSKKAIAALIVETLGTI